MIRLLALMVLLALALVAAVVILGAAMGGGGRRPREDTMPKQIANVSYAALILLMFGVTTGLIGGP